MSAPMGGSVRFPDADSRAPATTSAISQRRLIMLHIDRGVSVRFGARTGRLSPRRAERVAIDRLEAVIYARATAYICIGTTRKCARKCR
jgi:hypothetical protein